MKYCFCCPYCGIKLLKAANGKKEIACLRCGERFIIQINGNCLDIELIQNVAETPTLIKD